MIRINAQVSSYSFAQSSGTYTPITGGTVLATATTANNFDSQIWTIADGTIPFNFNFNNANYTGCVINSNGYITFGTTPPAAGTSAPISSTTAYSGAVSAWGGDLNAGFIDGVITGELSYAIEGSAPNREFVIQFSNWRPAYSTSVTIFPFINFQIRLTETSNLIKVVYGATGVAVGTATTVGTRQIGLRGATATDFKNRLNATTLNFNSSTEGTASTSSQAFSYASGSTQGLPNNGLTYTWTPPTCPSPTTLTTTAITPTSATLTWNVPFIVPSSGYEYVYSTTNTVPTGAGTSSTTNSVALTGLTSATTYYVFVRSNCGSEFGNWTSLGSFITLCNSVTDFIQNFDTSTTGVGNLPDCWEKAGTSANVYTTTASVAPMSPANRLYMNISTTTTAYALMPPVSNLQSNTHKLIFKAYATAASKKVQVGYFTNPADVSTFVLIQELDLPSTTATTALEFTVIPTAIPAGVSRLVFGLIAGSATTVYIDDVKWEVNSSCLEPTALSATSVTSNSAQLSWVNGGPETEWEVQYGLTGFTFGTGTIVTGVTTNPYLLSGLASDTSYQYYVRGVCTGTIYSSWSGPYTFRTLCVGVTDFVQNFENTPTGVGNLPACWSRSGTSANVYTTTASVAPMSPPNRLYMNISATTTAFATLPPVTNLQAETHRLRFKAYATAAAKKLRVGYFTNPADVSTYVFIEEIDLPSTAATTATEFTVIPYLSAVPGVTNLVFSLVAGTATTVYIDDVKWEYNSSCVEPTALNVLGVTNNTAQLSWANGGGESQWQVQYGLNGFTLGTGTIVNPVTTNPYTLTGLTANTTYQYYVRGECSGPEYSSWSGPFTFKTLCNGVTAFTENFDTWPTGVNSLPDCWSRAGSSTTTYITTGSTAPMSPANRLFLQATTTNEAYAILPQISNLQAGTNRLRFKAFTTLAPRSLIVGYMTNPSDVSTFVALQTFNVAGNVVANTQEYVVYPTGVPAGVSTLAIKNAVFTGATSTFYIDDVAWELIPACANPTGVSSSAVTSTTASIAWTGNPTDVSWEIEYGAPGFTLGTGTIVPAATNPFTLTGLASSTVFQYYIRSICAGPITSTNSISGSFTTLCAAFTPTYVQDFATFPALCWTRADAGTIATGPTGTGASAWANDGYLNVGTTGSIKYNLYQGGRIGWMVSPIFNLSAGGYEVKYDVGATVFAGTGTATMGADDAVNFLMSSDGGVTWTSMEVFNTANTPTNLGATKVYNISTLTSPNVLFAFRADEGPIDNTEDYDFFVDNFKVDLLAVAAPGCATNVVATQGAGCGNYPLAFSWNATPTANGYRINIGTTTGGTDVANNLDLGSALTYTIATPTPGTTYYYTVIPYNSVGNATGCTELSFATPVTPCACIPVYTTGVSSSDYVSVFALQGTTLNNNSGTSTTAPSYNLYTGQPNYTATLTQGVSYVANATVGFSNQAFAVWIDFNDNANFEASEKVGFTTTNVNTPSGTFNITIPCNATVGAHKMRVRMVYAAVGNTIDPCTSATFGEAEDYVVTIDALAAPTGNATQAFCGTPTVANLVAVGATGATIKWYDAATLGTELPSTTPLVTGTSYFASQTVGTCESATRLAVAVTVNPTPATPTGAASQTFCNTDNDDLADLVVTGTNLVWYDAPTAGNVLPTTTLVTATTYYVASNDGTCESPRLAITTTLDCGSAPANDLCSGAIALTPGGIFADNVQSATIFGATTTSGPTPSCESDFSSDVWYSVVVPASGSVTIETQVASSSSLTDSVIAAFSGTCGSLTQIGCDDDGGVAGVNDLMSVMSLSSLTPGSTIYVVVWKFATAVPTATNSQFQVSAYDASLATDSFDNSNFTFYPNPVKDVLNLSYSENITKVQVINLLGQEVRTNSMDATQAQVDMSNLPSGTYLVKVTANNKVKTIKVIKQ